MDKCIPATTPRRLRPLAFCFEPGPVDGPPASYTDRGIAIALYGVNIRTIHPAPMSTTGKRFAKRTSDKFIHRVLDARTKAVLNAVLDEQRGTALDAWLRAIGPRPAVTGRG